MIPAKWTVTVVTATAGKHYLATYEIFGLPVLKESGYIDFYTEKDVTSVLATCIRTMEIRPKVEA